MYDDLVSLMISAVFYLLLSCTFRHRWLQSCKVRDAPPSLSLSQNSSILTSTPPLHLVNVHGLAASFMIVSYVFWLHLPLVAHSRVSRRVTLLTSTFQRLDFDFDSDFDILTYSKYTLLSSLPPFENGFAA